MKKLWVIIVAGVLLGSCAEDTAISDQQTERLESIERTRHGVNEAIQSIWVCHHPESEFHNMPCIEEEYPSGCYVSGDQHKFCWVLDRKDCLGGHKDEQYEACRLFEANASTQLSSED